MGAHGTRGFEEPFVDSGRTLDTTNEQKILETVSGGREGISLRFTGGIVDTHGVMRTCH